MSFGLIAVGISLSILVGTHLWNRWQDQRRCRTIPVLTLSRRIRHAHPAKERSY